MGYSYCGNRLCCDRCGAAQGTTRKHACPLGWCPAAALCAPCWSEVRKNGQWAAAHTQCPARHAAHMEQKARGQALLDAGQSLRCSALRYRDGMVRVLFGDARRVVTGYAMTAEAYDALPLLEPYTPDHYRALGLGELIPAPGDFNDYYQGERCAAGADDFARKEML